ncbi:hypothetical protein EKE94_03220 [Mesobaculum littorinae]|uniref:Uncharacterized protein n=1 Tax=Mesobaculum littorinae TaxID=2486419 RepID=A0A438AMD6_9RHOB|nr:hypothetical protein [Mesobaculum littorinae]RVV99706.1 hypothetical protein EKE94_03220 [Mesobaculum littorinae]
MDYTVKRRHFAAGRFWNEGQTRPADPDDVNAQVHAGTLVAKAQRTAPTKPAAAKPAATKPAAKRPVTRKAKAPQ